MTMAVACCAVLIFGMIGLGNVASVVIIAVLYGFVSGTCELAVVPNTVETQFCLALYL